LFLTIRQRILNAILIRLANADYGMRRVYGYQPATFEQGDWPDPSCFVWAEDDNPAGDSIPNTAVQLESYKIPLVVQVWGVGNPKEFRGAVHKAMAVDRSWANLALGTDVIGSEIFTVDPERDFSGCQVSFNLFYRHYPGNPYSSAGEAPPDIPVGGPGMEWVEGGAIEWVEGGAAEWVNP